MKDQLFEELAKLHPDLFQKANIGYIECNNGWYNIIDTLCEIISNEVSQSRYMLKYELENQKEGRPSRIIELEARLAKALDELPIITQVKEKFGTLRFYVDGGSDELYNYISFAEAMSGKTCEICGDIGKKRHDAWVRTLCNKHYQEMVDLQEAADINALARIVKLSDDTDHI